MRLSVREFANDDTLGGSAKGANLLGKFIESVVHHADQAGPLFLDFRGIAIATSSFLRESVFGLRSYCRDNRPEIQVVIANPPPVVLEELALFLSKNRDALVACELDDNGTVTGARTIGHLDEKQRFALQAIIDRGEADATTLADEFDEKESVGATGWSNRLAALAAKGILAETRQGRTKIYRPVVKGLSHVN